MGLNETIISEFEKLVVQTENDINDMTDLKKKSQETFRLRSFVKALKKIKGLKEKIKSGDQMKGVSGFGDRIRERIDEILKKGKLKEIKTSSESKKKNKALSSLKKVIGIGDKKANELYEKGVKSAEDLIKKVKKNKVTVNDVIKMGLKYYPVLEENIPRKEMKKIEAVLMTIIMELDKKIKGKLLGSYRRKMKTSNDIDFTITHKKYITKKDLEDSNKQFIKKIVKKLKKEGYILDNIIDNPDRTYRGFFKLGKKYPVRQIDIKIVPYESYPTAILHSTGSGSFNEYMRGIAKKKGYKLNEYGLYKLKNKKEKRMKVESEKDIFKILDMEYVKPAKRNI